ncbi:His/Gly/Thr/Pro-type tRNA ligase C-terminal domain-containing protein [Enterococcus sp. LJL98]
MKQSNLLIPDFQIIAKEEVDDPSQRFLLEAGFLGSFQEDQYVFLPLAMRVIEKIKQIVTDELEQLSVVEFQLPVQSALHAEDYLTELLLTEQKNKQRPKAMQLYQIQTALNTQGKKNDHLLAKLESTYLDIFSFHETSVELSENYHRYEQLFHRILDRCEVSYQSVIAFNQSSQQEETKEIIADSLTGTEQYFASSASDYRGKIGIATRLLTSKKSHASFLPLMKKEIKVEKLAFAAREWLQPYFLRASKQPILLFLLKEEQLNLAKVSQFMKKKVVEVKSKDFEKYFGQRLEQLDVWHLSPEVQYLGDVEVEFLTNLKMEALDGSKTYFENINPLRDFPSGQFSDFSFVQEGDPSPDGVGELYLKTGVKIGQLYKKQPEKKATSFSFNIGHYQLDLSRLFLMIAQQHSHESGIIWPEEVAPFDLHVLPTNLADKYQEELVTEVEAMMEAQDYQVLIDDRECELAQKQREAALIGCPVEIRIGEKAVEGILEVRIRETQAVVEVRKEELADTLTILYHSAE